MSLVPLVSSSDLLVDQQVSVDGVPGYSVKTSIYTVSIPVGAQISQAWLYHWIQPNQVAALGNAFSIKVNGQEVAKEEWSLISIDIREKSLWVSLIEGDNSIVIQWSKTSILPFFTVDFKSYVQLFYDYTDPPGTAPGTGKPKITPQTLVPFQDVITTIGWIAALGVGGYVAIKLWQSFRGR